LWGAAVPDSRLKRCFAPATVSMALRVSLVIGTVLNLINHFDLLAGAPLTSTVALQMGLTYVVPYCVSTHGQVWGRRD
jgi:hypothetical protein